MNPLPKRLKKEPLIEVVWQAQFDGEQGVGDVLLGILLAELRKSHAGLQWRRLPPADIPAPIAQADPILRFAAKTLIEEPSGPLIWQLGDRVVTLNCRKPYLGWERFKKAVETLTQIIESSGLIPSPQRHSLRYIDLLTEELATDLSPLKLVLKLGDRPVGSRVQMRIEMDDNDCRHIVQLAAPTQVHLDGQRFTGTVVDIETLPADASENWDALRTQLDTLHDRSKALFFHQILTEETIRKLEPEY